MTATPTACAVALALPLVLGACSDDKATSSPTTAPVVTVIETAPAASSAPSSTVPAMTEAPASTVAATTGPPTTAQTVSSPTTVDTVPPSVPTTTLSPDDQAMAEAVARDWKEGLRLLRVAEMDPSDPVAAERALEYVTGEWTERTRAFLDGVRTNNQRILPTPAAEPTLTVESGPVAVAFTSDEVTIVVCEVNSWVLVETGTGPDGSDTVLNDAVNSYRSEVRLRLVDETWKVVDERVLAVFEDAIECGA